MHAYACVVSSLCPVYFSLLLVSFAKKLCLLGVAYAIQGATKWANYTLLLCHRICENVSILFSTVVVSRTGKW